MRSLFRAVALVGLIVGACGGGTPAATAPSADAAAAQPAKKPTTVAELALYKGADRQQLLEAGAKAEGTLVYYTSNSTQEAIAAEFMKKYPFVKVQTLRAQSTDIRRRLAEEFQSNKVQADIVEDISSSASQSQAQGMTQEYWSPELAAYAETAYMKGKNGGVYWWGDRESYDGLGWNTKLVSSAEAPKTFDDLLDPKWKGKMAVATSSLTVEWFGIVLESKGMDYVNKLKAQEIKAQNVSVAALLNLVISGEVPLSPTVGLSNVELAKKSGAPLEWRALEPVHTTMGVTSLLTKAPHPNAALLFLDYLHSKDGQTFGLTQGNNSPRKDVSAPYSTNFAKLYVDAKYGPDVYPQKYDEWQALFNKTFIASK